MEKVYSDKLRHISKLKQEIKVYPVEKVYQLFAQISKLKQEIAQIEQGIKSITEYLTYLKTKLGWINNLWTTIR